MCCRKLVSTVTIGIVLCFFCMCFLSFPIAADNSLKVAVCADLPLFHYVDEAGILSGMHIDMLDYIAAQEGCEIEYIAFNRTSEAIDALENRKADLVLGAFPIDVPKGMDVQFTEALSSASVCMLAANKDLEEVLYSGDGYERFRIAFELGTVSYAQLSRFSTLYTTTYGAQKQLYDALLKGKVEAVVCVKDSMLYLLEQSGVRENYTITTTDIDFVEYRLLLRNSDRALIASLNDAIGRLRASTTYEQLRAHWMIDLDKQDMQQRIRNLLWCIGSVVGIAGIIICGFYYMNSRLKVLVAEKTFELNEKMLQLESASILRNRLVEHSPGGNMLVQLDGTILLANPVARTMAALPSDEVDLGKIQNTKVFSSIWDMAFPLKERMNDTPQLIALGGGSDRHTYRYQCHLTSTQEEVVLLVEDVTWEERRKQEIFEERKNQTLNRIIAGVAHEIKNPLMSIRTFSSLIYSQRDDPEVQAAFQEYVPKEVDRISKMIETLINYARPPREHKEPISVRELVNDCVGLAYLSSKKKIEMMENIQEDVYLYANGDQLRQALVNLLINSIEAVESKMAGQDSAEQENLCVKVSGYRENGYYVLEIYDQGAGMSEEDILQCTDPFFTTKKSGTGMGLALTKQYVKENDGRLEIESVLGVYTKMKIIFKEDTRNETDRMDH